jgi:hypothetical protein
MSNWKLVAFQWGRKNCLWIIGISTVSALKYLLDYSGSSIFSDHDGLLAGIFAIMLSLFCFFLFFISLYKSSGIGAILDLFGGSVQFLIIFTGDNFANVSKAGLIANGIIVVVALCLLKFQYGQSEE